MRKTLTEAQKWWAVYPDIAATVQDDDDNEMTFAKATYRMCYKITDIPFDNSAAVTNHTLYVYTYAGRKCVLHSLKTEVHKILR